VAFVSEKNRTHDSLDSWVLLIDSKHHFPKCLSLLDEISLWISYLVFLALVCWRAETSLRLACITLLPLPSLLLWSRCVLSDFLSQSPQGTLVTDPLILSDHYHYHLTSDILAQLIV
jgi:hypothetical protein